MPKTKWPVTLGSHEHRCCNSVIPKSQWLWCSKFQHHLSAELILEPCRRSENMVTTTGEMSENGDLGVAPGMAKVLAKGQHLGPILGRRLQLLGHAGQWQQQAKGKASACPCLRWLTRTLCAQ